MSYTGNNYYNPYRVDRIDTKLYKGFKVVVTDYRNMVLNSVVREVAVTPISVPEEVYMFFIRRISEQTKGNRFDTLKEAKSLIDSCYRACSCNTVINNRYMQK